MQRDPAGVPAHHFEDHHAIVRLGGRVQPVQCFGRDIERGDKAERQLGARKIVIDSLWHAADRNATFIKLSSDRQCAFTTKHHECIDADDLHIRDRFLIDALDVQRDTITCALHKLSAIACSEDRSATWQQSAHVARRKQACLSSAEQAFKAIFDTDHAHAVFASGSLHDRANHGVETGCIAAASQNSNRAEHGPSLSWLIANCRLPISISGNSRKTIGNWQFSWSGVAYHRKWTSMTTQKR